MTKTIIYDTWRHFKSDFIPDLFGSDAFVNGTFIFRGQANADWPLVASFDRWFEGRQLKGGRWTVATELLETFRGECDHLVDFSLDAPDSVVVQALAQHHGVPTRLLDWTTSPYIAAFFAFSERLDSRDELHAADESGVAMWALRLGLDVWHKDSGVEIVRTPIVKNLRVRNQSGLFTICRAPVRSLEDYAQEAGAPDGALTKCVLPASEAKIALADLATMGISASHLFPGLDGAAQAARMHVLIERRP